MDKTTFRVVSVYLVEVGAFALILLLLSKVVVHLGLPENILIIPVILMGIALGLSVVAALGKY